MPLQHYSNNHHPHYFHPTHSHTPNWTNYTHWYQPQHPPSSRSRHHTRPATVTTQLYMPYRYQPFIIHHSTHNHSSQNLLLHQYHQTTPTIPTIRHIFITIDPRQRQISTLFSYTILPIHIAHQYQHLHTICSCLLVQLTCGDATTTAVTPSFTYTDHHYLLVHRAVLT